MMAPATMGAMSGVGTLNEKSLHAQLKAWYERSGDQRECPVDGFVIDLVRGDQLIEIQTRNLGSMRQKLDTLTVDHRVHVLYPVATEKWLTKIDDGGEIVDRRRSPKRADSFDVFAELVGITEVFTRPALTLEVVLIVEDELRRHEPGTRRRRRGWATLERRLVEVRGSVRLDDVASLVALLPDLPEQWTTADLSAAAGVPRRLAQQAAYCLRKMGAALIAGKDGNALVYRLAGP